MKKSLIFDPYLDTLGGGEFYSLSVGEFLLQKGFVLEIAWPQKNILEKIYQRFGLNFKNRVKINNKAYEIFNRKNSLFKKMKFTQKYNIIFYVSDGSIPFLFAQKNFLHFQTPFVNVKGRSLLNRLRLKTINKIICNSFFTKKFIDQEYRVKSVVVYPPLSDEFLKEKKQKKENIILSVGRFDQIINAKKQDVLVDVFKKMVNGGLKNWQFVLLGGIMKETKYFNKLVNSAKGYPIKIMTNVSFKTLINFYQKAKIYWHATGFGEDLNLYPQRAEHFGISIVEAMACNTVPIVFNGGGIPEIIGKKEAGLLWRQPDELIKKTKLLIKNTNLRLKLAQQLKKRALFFTKKKFFANLLKLLD